MTRDELEKSLRLISPTRGSTAQCYPKGPPTLGDYSVTGIPAIPAAKPPTPDYWNMQVHTDGGKGLEHGYCGVMTGFGGETLAEVIAEAFQTASYYIGLGYRVQISDAEEHCGTCAGSGKLRRGVRVIRYVRCKACRGKGILQIVPCQSEVKLSDALTVKHSAL